MGDLSRRTPTYPRRFRGWPTSVRQNSLAISGQRIQVPGHQQDMCEFRTTQIASRPRFRGLSLLSVGTPAWGFPSFRCPGSPGFLPPWGFPFPGSWLFQASSQVLQESSRSGYLSLYFRVSKIKEISLSLPRLPTPSRFLSSFRQAPLAGFKTDVGPAIQLPQIGRAHV